MEDRGGSKETSPAAPCWSTPESFCVYGPLFGTALLPSFVCFCSVSLETGLYIPHLPVLLAFCFWLNSTHVRYHQEENVSFH